jgi:hypothetical protein
MYVEGGIRWEDVTIFPYIWMAEAFSNGPVRCELAHLGERLQAIGFYVLRDSAPK